MRTRKNPNDGRPAAKSPKSKETAAQRKARLDAHAILEENVLLNMLIEEYGVASPESEARMMADWRRLRARKKK